MSISNDRFARSKTILDDAFLLDRVCHRHRAHLHGLVLFDDVNKRSLRSISLSSVSIVPAEDPVINPENCIEWSRISSLWLPDKKTVFVKATEPPISEEEWERRANEPGGRTWEEIRADLERRG